MVNPSSFGVSVARMLLVQSPLLRGGAYRGPQTRTVTRVDVRTSQESSRERRIGTVPKELKPEAQWVITQITISPVLKDSPSDLASAFAAHIAWTCDFGKHTLYRTHNNLSGIPYDKKMDGRFGISLGFPDARGRIARFSDLHNFVDAYLHLHNHLLKLSAREFFAHMRKNDLTPNAERRWDQIIGTWEKHFAERPRTI